MNEKRVVFVATCFLFVCLFVSELSIDYRPNYLLSTAAHAWLGILETRVLVPRRLKTLFWKFRSWSWILKSWS